ncbi:ABC transporter ATP-binding protein [Sphingomonas jatrophae]|uniref:NitT/TauT family transport system ATP-binding protein/sulfonate transport system ATP-binding protein n=1 Tax=Sphingomonas jatrophae TaxID=1166337 RepID=A0A1I6KB45_9SPHN|nr:ABC transporter ATP-binding protein [Sphingomonas jatrophae]SFR88090.1 NitT/TauT family transport system ATP-binding protein/sulfonate transport system ATP-binding protein [Sphingomonas jatrophae]
MIPFPTPQGTHAAPVAGALSIRGVSKAHKVDGRRLDVLREIDLDIAPAEFVGIVGASGCGKSTLLRLIIGLDNAYDGEIRLDGQRILSTSLDRGIVFQDHRLFPWLTVAQNVAVALAKRPLSKGVKAQLVAENIALVGLSGFESAYPHQLSGGMAQRAAIARALVNEPKVLLLDEPFGALDALTRLKLQQDVQALRRRTACTIVMVTHDVEEAITLADRVVVMKGRPGVITRIVPVGAQGRDRSSPAFARLRDDILGELMAEPATAAVANLDDARQRQG